MLVEEDESDFPPRKPVAVLVSATRLFVIGMRILGLGF
jgi:hypothetical protein